MKCFSKKDDMNIINQLTELFSNFQTETDDLKVQNEKLQQEISELRRIIGEYYVVLDCGQPCVWRNNAGEPKPNQKYIFTKWSEAMGHVEEHLNVYFEDLPKDWKGAPFCYTGNLFIEIKSVPEVK